MHLTGIMPLRFIEFLISKEAQEVFANSNYEYPVNEEVQPAQVIAKLG
jgi:iron(III) transport system substrate-binding protein